MTFNLTTAPLLLTLVVAAVVVTATWVTHRKE